MSSQQKGFTLIELLVVIAIIGILVAVVFVALDPATRFKQARDAVRQNDVQEVLSSVKLHQVDNAGAYLASVTATNAGEVYMIVSGALAAGCDDNNDACDTDVTDDNNCVDLAGLVTGGYVDALPVSPAGTVTWDSGTAEGTGYTLQRDATGIVHIRSCESEDATEISASR